jgi:hypothetical protein
LRRAAAAGLAAGLCLTGTGAVGFVSPASARTIKVCVKKKTGEMRLLTATKCKRGWKKYSWNKAGVPGRDGVPGKDGAPASPLEVTDKTGATVGDFVGMFPYGAVMGAFMVLRDAAVWTYMSSGLLTPTGGSPIYTTNTCAGNPYITASSPELLQILVTSAGGPSRMVYRVSKPTIGPAEGYRLTVTTTTHAGTIYERDATGTCVLDTNSPYTGSLVQLEKVPAPPDHQGPLMIG